MGNIHQLNILPKQTTINLIASYSNEFERENFDYHQLLEKLHNAMIRSHFMEQQDNTAWMNHQGHDYLANPKLFTHAPLTCSCVVLSEIFKHNKLNDIERKIEPNTLKAVLNRLNDFK